MIPMIKDILIHAVPLYIASVPVMIAAVLYSAYRHRKNGTEPVYMEKAAVILLICTIDVIIAATCYYPDFMDYFNPANLLDSARFNSDSVMFFNNLLIPAVTVDFHAFVNVFGNILMFMPLGFSAYLLCSRKKKAMSVVMASGAGFSLMIELTQITVGRTGDVMDIVLNTLGVYLGIQLYRYLYSLVGCNNK